MHLVGILTAAIGDLKLACLAESETKGEDAAGGGGGGGGGDADMDTAENGLMRNYDAYRQSLQRSASTLATGLGIAVLKPLREMAESLQGRIGSFTQRRHALVGRMDSLKMAVEEELDEEMVRPYHTEWLRSAVNGHVMHDDAHGSGGGGGGGGGGSGGWAKGGEAKEAGAPVGVGNGGEGRDDNNGGGTNSGSGGRLAVFVGSWNVNAKKPPSRGALRSWVAGDLAVGRDPNDTTGGAGSAGSGGGFGRQRAAKVCTVKHVDMCAIGLQETVELSTTNVVMSNSEIKKQSHMWEEVLLGVLNEVHAEDVQMPGSHSAHPDGPFVKVCVEYLVGVVLLVFVRRGILPRMQGVATCKVAVGIGGVLGNKGAVSLRFRVDETTVCLVSTHLTAHRGHVAQVSGVIGVGGVVGVVGGECGDGVRGN